MLQIKEEFKSLIFKLKDSQFKELENNCLEYGIRDAIVTWQGFIIDGHNRYQIAQKHNLDYKTIEMQFDSDVDVKVWMIDNALSRRNLNEWQDYNLREQKRKLLTDKKKKNKGGDRKSIMFEKNRIDYIKEDERHSTREIIADDLGWSSSKVAKADVVKKRASEEQIVKLENNDATINQVYQEIKKEEKKNIVKEKVEKYKEEIKDISDFDIDIFNTDKKFQIIYADPAWSYWEGGQKNQSLHYQTMSIKDICELPINKISDDNSILFLWVTYPILKESFEVIESWGFKYSTCGFVWVKKNKKSDSYFFGNGSWTRANSELCLIATKGSITRLDASISQIVDEKISEHSRKPLVVKKLITDLVGDLPRIELFSRNKEKDGWFNWGNNI
jgi:N6-adenosine-specific RNA methylase IME4